MDSIEYTSFESSLGVISVVSKNNRIIALDLNSVHPYQVEKYLLTRYPDAVESPRSFKTIRLLLDRYLRGEKVDFDVDVDTSGLNPFTCRVLAELRKIPYGELASYLSIGKRLGYPMAARAVGQAVKRNPIPIIIPCHRVIRDDGSLGGFSLGKQVKKRLLSLEGILDRIK
ncbi:MAG TPA: methylated-DNA--[protein]-cysteine S-methyltransferase [Syntrophorhabdaceae bacterium]|nr:methylated-DNA--[protein]-cysteine S-methyltransferase [Syntrophorhabdaceae bacterium]